MNVIDVCWRVEIIKRSTLRSIKKNNGECV